jgi:endo-1,4-beta-xylanase
MKLRNLLLAFALMLYAGSLLFGQANSVSFEAESGTLGSNFRKVDSLGTTLVTISTDVVNSYNPGNANRVITYQVTFPDTGTYDLYARIYVGPNGYNDDSYFYANGFGTKDPASNSDWIMCNGLDPVGYSLSTAVVNGAGGAQIQVWKWLDCSLFNGGSAPIKFKVGVDSLTQTFQIGGRENGLCIDKFVFGKSGLYYTVANLDNGQPGSQYLPGQGPATPPIAAGKSKFFGSEWDFTQEVNFSNYWNQVTPGNAGKWGTVEGTRGSWDWSVLDSTYNYAKRNKFLFKDHNLIWGQQQPSWISSLDSATQRQEIEKWFSALATHYSDSIPMIDVVNEPIHTPPDGSGPSTAPNANYIKALGGTGKTGWDWVITSFRLARKYFPKSKLILNEYSVINNPTTTQTYIKIINLLKADTLIDGIGEQAHAFTTYGTATSTLKSNLDALAATGIPLYITEMDVDGPNDLIQLQEFQRLFPIFWADTAVRGVTLWGFQYGVWRNAQGAYLIDESGRVRPALKWLRAYVNNNLVLTKSITITDSIGNAAISKAGDSTQMKATVLPDSTTIPNVSWSVSPAGLAKISSTGMLTAIANGTVTVTAKAYDGSGIKGTLDIVITNNKTSINTNTFDNILVYPNPAINGFVQIQGIEKIKQIVVMDLIGRKVNEYINKNQSSINLQISSQPGIYVIKFFDGQQSQFQKVLVK